MRTASLLLLALPASALPPLVPDFARLRDLREGIRVRAAEIREREEFESKPREERMLLLFRQRRDFEGKEIAGKAVVADCLAWAEARQEPPTDAALRVLALLPVVLRERYADTTDRKGRREVSSVLLKALDDDPFSVREAAIASLRAIYPAPRDDKYDAALLPRQLTAAIRAWKRHVGQANR